MTNSSDYKNTISQVIRIIAVRLKQVWVGMKAKSSQGNLTDEVVDCQQEQRQ